MSDPAHVNILCIDGYGRNPQGVEGAGGGNRFSKNLIFKRFAATFFLMSQEGSPGVKMDSVNLTFMQKKFSARYNMVPGCHVGVE